MARDDPFEKEMPMSTGLIFAWFYASIIIEFGSSLSLDFWLRKRSVKVGFLAVIPGNLEYAYLNWCRSQGRSARSILILRGLSLVNFVGALIAIMLFARNSS
jgi:hypothetical protein